MRSNEPILLVEDDIVDQMMVERGLQEIKINNPLVTVGNGEEALDYLRDEKNEIPVLIILDINMPKMNGIEFLKIKNVDEKLKDIPVVVLTTSKNDKDLEECFKLGIAGYTVKQVEYDEFVETMKTVGLYWSLSELP